MQVSLSGRVGDCIFRRKKVKEIVIEKNLKVRKKQAMLDPALVLRFNEIQTEFMSLINSPAGNQLALLGQAISERSSTTGLAHCDIYMICLRVRVQICLYGLSREH